MQQSVNANSHEITLPLLYDIDKFGYTIYYTYSNQIGYYIILTNQIGYRRIYMSTSIKELRKSTGLSQREFSSMYSIPLSTLRKWEQGESSPAPYVLTLLARTLPDTTSSLKKIKAKDGRVFYCDFNQKMVSDVYGNKILVQENFSEVKEQNLGLYLSDLFEGFYAIRDKFNRDCKYDKEDDILWS